MPIVCLVGIVANSLVIVTVKHKSNEKELKENQYNYMCLNACCNLLILSFQSISLISQCQSRNGLFCSSVRRSLFSQFSRIIFVEYLTHVFNVMSNLSYIFYSINRLSLIGQDHGKFVTAVSKMKLKKFILVTFMFCLVLPVSNIFTFIPNYNKPDLDYPDLLEFGFQEIGDTLMFLYLVSNILYNLITSIGFIVVNLIVDLSIFISLKKVIDERINTAQMEENQKKKK